MKTEFLEQLLSLWKSMFSLMTKQRDLAIDIICQETGRAHDDVMQELIDGSVRRDERPARGGCIMNRANYAVLSGKVENLGPKSTFDYGFAFELDNTESAETFEEAFRIRVQVPSGDLANTLLPWIDEGVAATVVGNLGTQEGFASPVVFAFAIRPA